MCDGKEVPALPRGPQQPGKASGEPSAFYERTGMLSVAYSGILRLLDHVNKPVAAIYWIVQGQSRLQQSFLPSFQLRVICPNWL